MNALKRWWNEEPIATRIGPVVVLIAGYLVTKGVIDEVTEELVIGIVGFLFGGGALLAARAKVSPLSKLIAAASDALRGDGHN